MVSTYPDPVRADRRTGGRHAAVEPDDPPPPAAVPWWRRLLPGRAEDVGVELDHPVIRVRVELDDVTAVQLDRCLDPGRRWRPDQVVVVHLRECGFVNLRGFRALLRLQEEIALNGGRLLVVDPPGSLRSIGRAFPGRLDLVPTEGALQRSGSRR